MTSSEKIASLLAHYPTDASAVRIVRREGGKDRLIALPNDSLNEWLKLMNKALDKHFSDWPHCMHGGIKKRSYVSFARPHVGKQCVISVDIHKCFDSITTQQISSCVHRILGFD